MENKRPRELPCLNKSMAPLCPAQDECIIYKFGFCQVFVNYILPRMGKEFQISSEEEDFYKDFYISVCKSLVNLNIRNTRGFIKFTLSIARKRFSDYLRKKEPFVFFDDFIKDSDTGITQDEIMYDLTHTSLSHYEYETPIDAKDIIEKIMEYLSEDKPSCVEIILNYLRFKGEIPQKTIAEKMGLKPNTYTQRLKRCIKYIRKKYQNILGEK